jgi:hypothetical protein
MMILDHPPNDAHDPMIFRYPEKLQNETGSVAVPAWPLYLSGIAAFGLVLLVL